MSDIGSEFAGKVVVVTGSSSGIGEATAHRCSAISKIAPVGRSATPDDCAEAVLALVHNRSASGEIFVVDGGSTLAM